MWITPQLVSSNKRREEWMEIQKSEVFSLQHLENLSDSAENPLQSIQFTASPMKFSYRFSFHSLSNN